MNEDPFAEFKEQQRQSWSNFSPTAMFTTPVAGHLVRFAEIVPGQSVLDVGTGTGVVAITAARNGAKVSGLDLTPALVEEAIRNAYVADCEVQFEVGDAEALPYPDATFDVVLSQFGHMFAPNPRRAVAEMRRVLKPGGRIAFATWPPEHLVGKMFSFLGARLPPPPPGAAPPAQWGNPGVIAERLAESFAAPHFQRGTMMFAALSLAHYRSFLEETIGPFRALVQHLRQEVDQLAAVRAEFESMVRPFYRDNVVHQDYLLTRAQAI